MSPARARYHHGDLPRALVDASLTLIGARGVDGFSLRAAAREAGVDPAAVYRHFADRSDLLGAVAAVGFGRLGDRMAEALAGADGPAAGFAAAGRAYVRFAREDRECFRVMFGPHGSGPDGVPRGRGAGADGRTPYDLLVEVLAALAAEGAVAGPLDEAALTAWSTVHGLAALLVEGAVVLTDPEVDAAVDRLTRSALRGLAG
jgi:AcrR family transcriptional regulator